MTLTPIDAGHRIQLPAEWVESLGLRGQVALERTGDGILVRPAPPATWDEFFATKLVINSAPAAADEGDLEATGDDLLF
jgi:hypothetical protein